jgi:prepilin-type N-terminal cleavage/methylation domain-containing protein
MKLPCRSRIAFTLLEVLAALTLSGILAVLVAALMRSGLQESRLAQNPRLPITESGLLREQMEADIANARAYAISPNAVMLGGFLSRDPASGDLTQHLTIVTYQVAKKGRFLVLERIEKAPRSQTEAEFFSEAVWDDVASLKAVPCAEYISGSIPVMPELAELGMKPLTHGMFLQLFDSQGRIILEIPGTMTPTSAASGLSTER